MLIGLIPFSNYVFHIVIGYSCIILCKSRCRYINISSYCTAAAVICFCLAGLQSTREAMNYFKFFNVFQALIEFIGKPVKTNKGTTASASLERLTWDTSLNRMCLWNQSSSKGRLSSNLLEACIRRPWALALWLLRKLQMASCSKRGASYVSLWETEVWLRPALRSRSGTTTSVWNIVSRSAWNRFGKLSLPLQRRPVDEGAWLSSPLPMLKWPVSDSHSILAVST